MEEEEDNDVDYATTSAEDVSFSSAFSEEEANYGDVGGVVDEDAIELAPHGNAVEEGDRNIADEEEEDEVSEEEEVEEVVQPAPRKRPRMLAELQSTLDGRYWREATTRRVIDRD
jgi:hypothetical protein